MKPGGRLAPIGKRRRSELAERKALRERVIARDGGCRAQGLIEHTCAGRAEVHELIRRSQWKAGWLVDANCVALCSVAHRVVTTEPALAFEVGLALHGWQRGEVS